MRASRRMRGPLPRPWRIPGRGGFCCRLFGAPSRHGAFAGMGRRPCSTKRHDLILPPGQGMTCVESVHIDRPLMIATYGGDAPAVIQAPDGAPGVEADIPLGDKVVFDGVTFIARGHDAPCVLVRAGHVVMRNAHINSRSTNWAFDVVDSGEAQHRQYQDRDGWLGRPRLSRPHSCAWPQCRHVAQPHRRRLATRADGRRS